MKTDTTIIISADDYGVTRGVTDTILETIDAGSVSSVSVIANGDDFERAIEEAKNRPDLRVSLHLNLTDGKPLADISQSGFLDANGNFSCSFMSLWLRYLLSSSEERRLKREAVKRETRAQVLRVQDALSPTKLAGIDGHEHVHMIPFIFDAVREAAEELGVPYIRIPEEAFFFGSSRLLNYFGRGVLIHLLLNFLSRRARKEIRKKMTGKNISSPDAFVGGLFSGEMRLHTMQVALKKILSRQDPAKIVEVLFHPGSPNPNERRRWPNGGRQANQYFSANRRREREELLRPEFKEFIKEFQ